MNVGTASTLVVLVLLFPLIGAALNGFLGPVFGRQFVNIVGTASILASFVVSVPGARQRRRRARGTRRDHGPSLGLDQPRRRDQPLGRHGLHARRAERADAHGHHRCRLPHPCVQRRLHGARHRIRPLLQLHELLHLLDVDARARRRPGDPHHRLGTGRVEQLPVDRLLARPSNRRSGGSKSLHHAGDRRRCPGDRRVPDRAEHAHAQPAQHLRAHAGISRRRGAGHRRLRAARHRRIRQERAVPAAHMAAGRDGGPDAGFRAHPCRDHGHRRRLPHRAVPRAVQPGARSPRDWSPASAWARP